MKPLIPMFYYSLKILFVDDDRELLEAYLSLDMPNQMSVMDKPQQALTEILQNPHDLIPIFNDISKEYLIDSLKSNDEKVISFTFDTIKQLILNRNKYKQYGIVVVDYDMPEVNGIELCNNLTNKLNIIKVLLTGKYNPLDAIQALNNGIIDYFLPKGKATIVNELIDCIEALQLKYFKTLTQTCLELTKIDFAFLSDKHFVDIINKFIKDYKIQEYYLVSNTGCFIMMNANYKYVLNIYMDDNLNEFCEMYAHLDSVLIKKVVNRELIPNFEIPITNNESALFFPCINSGKYYYNFSKLTF